MLKLWVGLLLLANGVLLAAQQGHLDALLPDAREPARMAEQIHPEYIRLIRPGEPLPEAQPVPSAPEPVVQREPVTLACVEAGTFDAADAKRFEAAVAAVVSERQLIRRPISDNARHMVYVPSLGNKEAADRKAAELRALGIKDFFVIQDRSDLQWSISLGVFKSEEAARTHLAALSQQGVRSARLGTHAVNANKFAFELRGLDAVAQAALEKVKTDFTRQSWGACS